MSAEQYHQVTLFEWQNGGAPFNPLETVVSMAGVYWTHSRRELVAMIRNGATADELAKAVRHHYCPYGFAGRSRIDDQPATVWEYDMDDKGVRVKYNDESGRKRESRHTWRGFGEALRVMYWRGEYGPEDV